MNSQGHIAIRIFNKLFKKIAEEEKDENNGILDPRNVLIGIYFEGKEMKYKLYNGQTPLRDIDLDDYLGIFDGSTFIPIISENIGIACVAYSKQEPACGIESVKVILQNKEGDLPNAVLMKEMKKDRNINIEKEFFS